jgi:hypothetical protein
MTFSDNVLPQVALIPYSGRSGSETAFIGDSACSPVAVAQSAAARVKILSLRVHELTVKRSQAWSNAGNPRKEGGRFWFFISIALR